MKLENFIAAKYVRYSGTNKEISSSFKAVFFSIVAAVVFYIASASVMNGYIYGIMKLSFEVKSFHCVQRGFETESEAESYRIMYNQDQRVKYSGIFRETSVLLSSKGKNTVTGMFRILPENIFKGDLGFSECITLKDGTKSLLRNEIMISDKTAEKLFVKSGDTIFFTAMSNGDTGQLIIRKFKISGIFTTGLIELDEQLAFIGTTTGNNLFGNSIPYNIMLKLSDYRMASDFTRDYIIKGVNGLNGWDYENYSELTALKFQKNIIAFIVILAVLVAVLNILSTIYITIHEKSSDIGILKSIGYSPENISLIFIINGVYLAIPGIVAGIIFGLFVSYNLNAILNGIAAFINAFFFIVWKITSFFFYSPQPENIVFFSKEFYLDKIYTYISFGELLFITFVIIAFSIAVSSIPAMKAGKIKPDEVLKDE